MAETLTYEAWRISYQSSEQAARAAFAELAAARAREQTRVREAYFEGYYDAQRGPPDGLVPWRASRARRLLAAPTSAAHTEAEKLGPWGCRCQTFHHRMSGDGCEICQPEADTDTGEESHEHREDSIDRTRRGRRR